MRQLEFIALWITEVILTYDRKPSYTVSIMEFRGDKVARETQYFADPFVALAWRAQWGRTDEHIISRRENWEGKRWILSSPACVALLIDMTVAVFTDALSTMPKGLWPLNWLDDCLCLPEVLYVLFFIWLICSGPGRFSADYWLAGKLPG